MHNLNIFVNSEFNKAFDNFWTSTISKLPNKQVIGLLVKVKDSNGSLITLGPLSRINKKSNRAELRTVLFHYAQSKGESYNTFTVSSIIFQYIYLNNVTPEIPKKEVQKLVNYSSGDFNYPLSTDLSHWGTVIKSSFCINLPITIGGTWLTNCIRIILF